MAASIDVVIPVRDRFELTDGCLRHLHAQTLPHRTIVVDGGSTDGTADRLRERWPDVRVERAEHVLGFAQACNRGVAAGCADVIVLLNNDVECRPDFLERLLAPLQSDARVGAVAALMLAPGERFIDSVGLSADVTLAGFPRHQGLPAHCAPAARPLLSCPAGTAAAYRRAAWEQVGGLDEGIFAYLEDLDLGLRLRAAGWQTVAACDAIGVHLGSASHGRRSASQRHHSGFARGWLLRRYGLLRGRHAPRVLLTEAIAVAGDSAISRDLSALRGRLSGWRAARDQPRRRRPPAEAIDRRISLRTSLTLRRGVYRMGDASRQAASAHAGSGAEQALQCLACGSPLSGRQGFAARDRLHGTPGRFAVIVCATCGSGTTAPAVTATQLGAYYPPVYGPYEDPFNPFIRLASTVIRGWQSRRAAQAFPLRALLAASPGSGVDVGCGRGDMAASLIAHGWRMTGVEPSHDAAIHARARGVEVQVGTLADVELEPARFDAAIFQHSLEHTIDPLADLTRLNAALKPGGIAIITVPNFANWQARRLRSCWFHLDVPRHRVHFTDTGLVRLLERAGYEVLEQRTSTSAAGLPASLQYVVAGHCLFPAGLPLRVASGLCAISQPFAALADRIGGGGDQLHVLARRPTIA